MSANRGCCEGGFRFPPLSCCFVRSFPAFRISHTRARVPTPAPVPGTVCLFCCTSVLREKLLSICTSTLRSAAFPGRLIFAAGAGILRQTCCNVAKVRRAGTPPAVIEPCVCPPHPLPVDLGVEREVLLPAGDRGPGHAGSRGAARAFTPGLQR